MNLIAPLLCAERICIKAEATTRNRIFEEAGRLCAGSLGLDATQVAESLAEREAMGSTALGQGFALPHARLRGLRQPQAAFMRLDQPIPFNAPDGKPVSDLLVLLVPEKATEAHLQLLAEAAQMFGDRRFRETLRLQGDAAAVQQAFADWPAIRPKVTP